MQPKLENIELLLLLTKEILKMSINVNIQYKNGYYTIDYPNMEILVNDNGNIVIITNNIPQPYFDLQSAINKIKEYFYLCNVEYFNQMNESY